MGGTLEDATLGGVARRARHQDWRAT
ncbi:hypothetical protein CHELA40_11025 [Chelatococcus asaccharovorans]|nr:hypothetical protein CHELA40_11025 [Chelatococcus asaccharovorans]CAH1685569.1 hypothetical protein CHELA17_64572 [Chelatococcus asaccharovorans]